MKSLVLCHSSLRDAAPELQYEAVMLFGKELTFTLMEADRKDLASHADNEYAVLVRKTGFSLNFRDQSILLRINSLCEESAEQGILYYSPIGSEFVAEVVSTGKSVTTLKPGDRVIPDGTFPAEYREIRGGVPSDYASDRFEIFHERQLLKIPDAMPDEIAAGFTIGAQTAYAMVRKAGIRPGENVLITAASSSTSIFALAALQHSGANIYLLSASPRPASPFERYRFTKLLHAPLDAGSAFQQLSAAIGGFDVVIDPYTDIYLSPLISHIKMNGRYVTCGFQRQHNLMLQAFHAQEGKLFPVILSAIANNISIIGNCLGNSADLRNAVDDYCNGKLSLAADSIYTGDDFKAFIERSFNDRTRVGKTVYLYEGMKNME